MFVAVLALAIGTPAPANLVPGCETISLGAVVNDHDSAARFVLVTANGRRYRTLGQDFVPLRKWRGGDALRVCRQHDDSSAFDVTNLRRQEAVVAEPGVLRRSFADTCIEPESGDTGGQVVVLEESDAEPRVTFSWSEGALMPPVRTAAMLSPDGRLAFNASTPSGIFHFNGRLVGDALVGMLTEPWSPSARSVVMRQRTATKETTPRCRHRAR